MSPEAVPAKRQWSRAQLGPFLVASVLLHGALLSVLPLARLEEEGQQPEAYTEITLLPQPEEMELVAEPAIGGDTTAAARARRGREEGAPYLPADLPAILGRAQAIRGPEAADGPPIDVDLPASTAHEPGLDLAAVRLPLYTKPDAPEGRPPTTGEVLDATDLTGEVAATAPQQPRREHAPDFHRVEALVQGARGSGAAQGLLGPAAERSILEQPPAPEVEVAEDTIIRLRFWVLADGTVGEVYPLQKGGAELERVASEYMRRWRFNPLPEGVAKVWGEITIKFRPS